MSNPCPEARDWQALLDEAEPATTHVDLYRHLENCPECQRTLDIVVADADCWQEVAQGLGSERSALTQDPLLRETIERLKNQATTPTDAGECTPDELPSFLASDRPEVLGRLGSYEIRDSLGRGGMGMVFKAFDPGLQRLVAIKVMAPRLSASGAARKRFVREARATAAVIHDHVITIHAVEEADGLPYLVMQYIAGPSLQQKLEQTGPLPVTEILRIGLQTASGLAAAHAQGLIHRDVKPANILLENGIERVKLTDFGLARAVDEAGTAQERVVAGTPEYMAPEQARGETLDHRADLYSLGGVLYALCTGRPPFRGESTTDVLRKVSAEDPPPIRDINPEIPEWLAALVERLLSKEPANRFGSAAEVAALLEQHLARWQHAAPAAPPVAQPSASARHRPPSRSRRWLVAATVLLIATLSLTEATGFTAFIENAATVLRIKTPEGTLVVVVDDPQVNINIDGQDVVITGAGAGEIRLRPGEHRLRAVKQGVPVRDEIITVTRGGKQLVHVSLEETAPRAPVLVPPAGRVEWQPDPRAPVRVPPPVRAEVQAIPAPRAVPQLAPPKLLPRPTEGKIFDQPVAIWGVPEMSPSCGAFAPNDKTLVTGLWDGTAVVWDLMSGKKRAMLRTGAAQLRTVAISPEGKTVATGTSDQVVRLWDVESGALRQELTGHNCTIFSLAYSPDGTTLASCGGHSNRSGELRLWDVKTGKPRVLVPAFEKEAWSVAYAPDGRSVAVALGHNEIGRATVLSADAGKIMVTYLMPAYARRVAFSPDGKRLAVSYGEEGMVKVLDAPTGKEVISFQANAQPVFSLAYTPDGKSLLTSGVDGTAVIWDPAPKKARRLATFLGHQGTVYFAAMSHDGRTLATGGGDRAVRLWDIANLLPRQGDD